MDTEAPAPVSLGPRPRILVVKLATLGDLLLCTPMLRALRTRYPNARLDVLTTSTASALLAESPLVDRVVTLDVDAAASAQRLGGLAATALALRRCRYDAVVLAHHLTLPAGRLKHRLLVAALNPRLSVGLDNGHGAWLDLRTPDLGFGAKHEADYLLQLAAVVDASAAPNERRLDCHDLGWGDLPTFREPRSAPRIALHPGSGLYSIARRWPLESFVTLASRLHERVQATIVVLCDEGERELATRLVEQLGNPGWAAIEETFGSPRQLAEILSSCDLMIGNDSFPMHMATALRLPTVGVFGPTNERAWGPYAPLDHHTVAVARRTDLTCSPCVYRGHTLGTPAGCARRPCLTELPVTAVLRVALRLLAQPDPAVSPAG